MNKHGKTEALTADESINNNYTAIPKDSSAGMNLSSEDENIQTQMDYGDMNAKDARESGYIDDKGHAVSMARHDVKGSPTGAYTDVGAGRSSVVHHHDEKGSKH